uniref:Uncharacterized protein n=1 Tax=Chromera velia CCMP2878 TaxID=1169474 RepID=A0A0G4FEC4_9ALVE|eukprot:Cvel_16569.t1-p1 / transcript=Cvel_16569.t1 / gene=Cvel_16569 / organism=Chromera_velia_CCMP2878 / gene_product=hypothetical protein / transcript_product=hypothetical protein / location=Cvel_scaffold1282:17931-19396(+) / protein_length=255 / sequence_SO=supercontig / SO=protein_coding / is_pseudo=false
MALFGRTGKLREVPRRFWGQLAVTVAAASLGLCAVALCAVFLNYVYNVMKKNVFGTVEGDPLPCVRAPLPTCIFADSCTSTCCPVGFDCLRDPVVGVACKLSADGCGNFDWCRDFFDLPRTCRPEECRRGERVAEILIFALFGVAVGSLLDLVDFLLYWCGPDRTLLKAGANLSSAIMKFLSLTSMAAVSTMDFMADLGRYRCYDSAGRSLWTSAYAVIISFAICCGLSGLFSLVLAGFSAYWGGRVYGIPYVRY